MFKIIDKFLVKYVQQGPAWVGGSIGFAIIILFFVIFWKDFARM